MELHETAYCAIDLETTGLDVKSDEIIAFAGIPIRHMKIVVHDAYYTLVKPQEYRLASMKYHGIGESELNSAPAFQDVAQDILRTLDGVLVGHSVAYDFEILRRQFKKVDVKLKRSMLDIVSAEKWLAAESGCAEPDLTLEGMMKRYGLKSYYRHNAFADAFFTAQIFQLQLPELLRRGVHTVEKLVQIARRQIYSDHDVCF